MAEKIKNKGTGAGGSNTTLNGKRFEERTDNTQYLLKNGYIKEIFTNKTRKKYHYYIKMTSERTIVAISGCAFKHYMKKYHGINVIRYPDEAYIIEENDTGKIIIKILEKKEQNVEGSVETKLWSCFGILKEYEIIFGTGYKIFYGFCVSRFLEKKFTEKTRTNRRFEILNKICSEYKIPILFGDNKTYFAALDEWINN